MRVRGLRVCDLQVQAISSVHLLSEAYSCYRLARHQSLNLFFSFTTYAIAWADSKAGNIPSSLHKNLNPSNASVSFMLTYSALLLSSLPDYLI